MRADTSRRQRAAVLSIVFALHALFLAFLLRHVSRAEPVIEPGSIAIMSIEAERPATATPPPPTLPTKIAKTFKPITEVSIPAEAEDDSSAGATSVCSTIGAVLEGLVIDPMTLVALRTAPPETRSIAGAVMMWNEAWVPAASAPDAPLWSVRINLESTLAKVTDACLDEELIGPRLLPIAEADGNNLFVVFGSGRWTWRQMLAAPASLEAQRLALPEEPEE